MTHDKFNHLVSLMLQNRRSFKTICQEYSKKKADGFIVAVVNDTSSTEINTLLNEGYGCCIFSGETYGTIELWIYERTVIHKEA